MEAQLALTEVAFQSDDKLAAKNLSEHRDGKKEAIVQWTVRALRKTGRPSRGIPILGARPDLLECD